MHYEIASDYNEYSLKCLHIFCQYSNQVLACDPFL